MKYKLLTILFLIYSSISVFCQNDSPKPNPEFARIIGNLSHEKMRYLPLFLLRYNPDDLNKFSPKELEAILYDSLNVFIADSGKFFEKTIYPERLEGLQPFTTTIMLSLKKVGKPRISPNGNYFIFTISNPSLEENKSKTDIYIMAINGIDRRQLTFDNASSYDPVWSPDGSRIAYLSSKTGSPQIFTMDMTGDNVKQITNVEEGVSNFAYSPDGKYFSYTSDVKLDTLPKDKFPYLPKMNVREFESLPIRHWDEWKNGKYSHLFIVSSQGGTPRDLMPGEKYDTPLKPFDEGDDIAWSPDSKEITYTCKKVRDFVLSTNSDLYVVDIVTGKTKNITDGMPGYDKQPLYSPDGNWIAFHSMERAGFEADRVRLMLYNRATGKITELSKTLDQWVGDIAWAPDSKSIYFNAEDGPTVPLYNIKVDDGTWKILNKGWYNCDGGFDITPNGNVIVFARRNMLRPFEIYRMPFNGGEITQLTHENDLVCSNLVPCKITERWIKSTDGKKVHCWVIFPPDFDSTKKYPMITYCQGGPQSTISQYFSLRWNLYLMASHGYIVLAPNRRGMPGFGQDWNDAISKDWGGGAMQDILSATDELSKEKYVDKKGIAAAGASAGGYATFWLEGNHKKRFAAFVSHCGVFDVVSKYGSTEETWFPNWEFGGPYWEAKNKAIFEKNSPHNFAQNWDTPIMISTGEKDFRVPYTQSLEAFSVAQLKGIPSKLIVFPDQNHWILKPQEQMYWYNEFFEFLDKYCKH